MSDIYTQIENIRKGITKRADATKGNENMFEIGKKVYHKNLDKIGIFDGYDDLDTDTCFVCFECEPGIFDDWRRVSINQLISEKEMSGSRPEGTYGSMRMKAR